MALARLRERLADDDPGEAWAEFLAGYGRLILQVVHHVEWNEERRTDCFVYVCEELSRDRCRRLSRFDPAKGASFATWVRVVAHNLCLDWRRKRHGRFRPFRSLAELSALDEEIYRCAYLRGMSARQTLETLLPDYPGLTEDRVGATLARIRRRLTPRQHWLLSQQRPRVVSLDAGGGGEEAPPRQLADSGPDPELLAAARQRREHLAVALRDLPDEDRLLVRLRYQEGLTLRRVAELAGMKNAQQADRRLRRILARLRRRMEAEDG